MGYQTLQDCVADLDRNNRLIRITEEVDPHLEAAEIQRRVYRGCGPAVLYENVKGCSFRMVSNLFGSLEQSRFLFRDTIEHIQRLVKLAVDPAEFRNKPWSFIQSLPRARHVRPKRKRSGPVLRNRIKVSDLPQLKSWPDDGGPFVTLPQVYTEHPIKDDSNLGMYRIQLAGNEYMADQEIGLHYQIHRGIGVHHTACLEQGCEFPVNIFVGGTPAMTLSAVMPLPEGMSELMFAGVLAGHRIPMIRSGGLPLYAEADFCITGHVDLQRNLPEGPFGDHLGYYSLAHPFPVLKVDQVYHRDNAIWPFTVVGRPPQEDTSFGELIHELTGPAIPATIKGVQAVHAVDVAGVHPLLFAIGTERYTPYSERDRPQEILTQANAILGQGQLSLAKYLMIAEHRTDDALNISDVPAFLAHMLQRCDWKRDLHFQTQTSIDTLDYSGEGLNRGSKLVMAASGPARFELGNTFGNLSLNATEFTNPKIAHPGWLAIAGPRHQGAADQQLAQLAQHLTALPPNELAGVRVVLLCDDPEFLSRSWENLVWATFTRSNPAVDIEGVDASTSYKHWGCRGPLIIDIRVKPHHAPPLIEDPEVTKRVDALAARNRALAKFL